MSARQDDRQDDRRDDRQEVRRGPWRRYVAVGDSFTEGMVDPDPTAPAGADAHRGWADRLAGVLAEDARAAGGPELEYANLAVRGLLQGRILDEQLPAALALGPDLVSLSAGGNDLLRPGADVDAIAARTEDAVVRLRAAGADVLLVTGVDPQAAPLLRLTRPRVMEHNLHLWSIAQRHGAVVLDLWGLRPLYDLRMWAEDRIHLSTEGHRRVAHLAAATLLPHRTDGAGDVRDEAADEDRHGARGVVREPAGAEWAQPLAPQPRAVLRTLHEDARWVGGYVAPWVRRRVTGRSSGDGRSAKRPVPAPPSDPGDLSPGPAAPH